MLRQQIRIAAAAAAVGACKSGQFGSLSWGVSYGCWVQLSRQSLWGPSVWVCQWGTCDASEALLW